VASITESPGAHVVTREVSSRQIAPRAQRTALAVGAGVVTAVVIAVASGIAGHWG
jgi:hypothetical protein